MPQQDVYAQAIAALMPDGTPPVWSLIVTVFGDVAGDRAVELGAAPLARILAPAGVSGSALRVAMHRLKTDGWVLARRAGRSSFYRLNPDRLATVSAASKRIYATGSLPPDAWRVRILGPDAQDHPPTRGEAIMLGPRIAMFGADGDIAPGALELFGDADVPQWVRSKVCPPDLMDAYQVLHASLATVERLLRGHAPDLTVESVALRMLVVHAWRRIILRHPALPDGVFPSSWPGSDCRQRVGALLSKLPRPTASQLAEL
ncbi:MAG: PaaX family transcriptional regulator C-terminal domain-containing protein [Pseudomonadota bacterium]